MAVDLDDIYEQEERAAEIKFENKVEIGSYVDCYIDNGFDEVGVYYSKDRSTIAFKNTLVQQYSYVDLLEFSDFFEHRDLTKLDPELFLVVLPNQMHLLSILMQDEQFFVEVCDHIHEKYKDADSEEDIRYLKRLLQIILMPSRSLKPADEESERQDSSKLSYSRRISKWLQSFVDIKLDDRNRRGYQSVAQKSLHNKFTIVRDALMRLVMLLKDDCSLAIFLQTMKDLEVLMNALTP
jgi:hypothetical protein